MAKYVKQMVILDETADGRDVFKVGDVVKLDLRYTHLSVVGRFADLDISDNRIKLDCSKQFSYDIQYIPLDKIQCITLVNLAALPWDVED